MWGSGIIKYGQLYHAAGVPRLLEGDHPLLLDQTGWGEFDGKVQVSHHTPFHWLHLTGEEHI